MPLCLILWLVRCAFQSAKHSPYCVWMVLLFSYYIMTMIEPKCAVDRSPRVISSSVPVGAVVKSLLTVAAAKPVFQQIYMLSIVMKNPRISCNCNRNFRFGSCRWTCLYSVGVPTIICEEALRNFDSLSAYSKVAFHTMMTTEDVVCSEICFVKSCRRISRNLPHMHFIWRQYLETRRSVVQVAGRAMNGRNICETALFAVKSAFCSISEKGSSNSYKMQESTKNCSAIVLQRSIYSATEPQYTRFYLEMSESFKLVLSSGSCLRWH